LVDKENVIGESLTSTSQLNLLDQQVTNSKQLLSQLQQLHVRSMSMAFTDSTDHLSFMSKQQEQLDQLQSIIDEQNRQINQLEKRIIQSDSGGWTDY
jgi:vacuolar-type H+-ATPase subunit D/Vma8